MSGSTRSKADRIVKDLAKAPAHQQPRSPRGHFAAWCLITNRRAGK
jgi:hypothetical protein